MAGGEPPPPSPPRQDDAIPSSSVNTAAITSNQRSFLQVVQGQCDSQQPLIPHFVVPDSINFKPIMQHRGKPSVAFTISERRSLIDNVRNVLVGKFSHGRPQLDSIKDFFSKLNLKGIPTISIYDNKHIFIVCSCKADFVRIWLQLVWKIKGFDMRVFKWFPEFSPTKESSIVPVWVRFQNLPLYMFDEMSLLQIANSIGRPIKVDPRNVNRTILNSARVCIELDVDKPLMDSVWVSFVDEASRIIEGFWVKVHYDVLPLFCEFCFHMGHGLKSCKRRTGEGSVVNKVFDGLSQPISTAKPVLPVQCLANSGDDPQAGNNQGHQVQQSSDVTRAVSAEIKNQGTKASSDSKTLQRTNSSCRQIKSDMQDQQDTAKVVVQGNVQNFMQQVEQVADHSLQGAKVAFVQGNVQNSTPQQVVLQGLPGVAVQNSFDILNSEGLDSESNLQQLPLQGADVAAVLPGKPHTVKQQNAWQQNSLKRQMGCVGNNIKTDTGSATIGQAGTGATSATADMFSVQSQGSRVHQLPDTEQVIQPEVASVAALKTHQGEFDAIKRADSDAYNVDSEVAVTTPECHGQIGMVANTFTQADASEHVCQIRQDGSIVVDVKASNFVPLADDSVAALRKYDVEQITDAAEEHLGGHFSCFMSSQKHNTTALASKQIDIVAGHADSSLSKDPIEKRLSWVDLAEEDEIETISKLTLSEAKEYARQQIEKIMGGSVPPMGRSPVGSSISTKPRRGRTRGRTKRSPR